MNYKTLVMEVSNLAVTQYCNFNFNSFCEFNGTVIAASENGLYSLEGTTDAGSAIQASFKLLTSDWGVENLKRIRSIYIGYETKGDLELTTFSDEDNVKVYNLPYHKWNRQGSNKVNGRRDAQGRYWSIKISNVNGSSFAIDSIDILPIILNKKPRI